MDAAKKYEYIKTLGEGSYGHVWLCRDRERDCLVAIKKFKDANKDSQAYHLAMREIKLLRATTHEHVVSVIEAFRSQSSGNVYLVMEYAESCLNLELKKHRTGLPSADVMRITWQLASSLQYLHSKKIIHRDLKPANILLTAAGDLKLCDFGFARDLPPAGPQADMSSYVTTRWYRAPEVVVGADYGAAVDIWALGCLFAELLNGQPLFPGASNMDQLALIVACFGHLPNRLLAKALTNPHLVGVQLRTGNPRNWAVALQQRFAPYGEHAVTLLLSCLNPDPLKRATADEVLRSPYFEPIRMKKVAAMNGPASVATSASLPTAATTATTAAPQVATASAPGPVHPAAAIPPSAAANAAMSAMDSSAAAAAAVKLPAKDPMAPQSQPHPPLSQPHVLPQPQQPHAVVVATPVPEPADAATSSVRTSHEAAHELQPERPAAAPTPPAVLPPAASSASTSTSSSALTGTLASTLEQQQPPQGGYKHTTQPMHPALVMASATKPTPPVEATSVEEDGAGLGGQQEGAGPGSATEVETAQPAAPAATSALVPGSSGGGASTPPQRPPQVRFQTPPPSQLHHSQEEAQLRAAVSAANAGMSVVVEGAAETLSGGDAASLQHAQQQRLPLSALTQLRASMAVMPMTAANNGSSSATAPTARSTTDTGMGSGQGPVPPLQGKAGATLVQHNKRASEHSIGVYGNPRGPGGSGVSDMPMRLARVSLVNPNIDISQITAEATASTTPSPSTTPAGAAAPTGTALISPAGALTGAAAASSSNAATGSAVSVSYVGGTIRRRSTATGSRLTRVSHTCEGTETQHQEDSDEDRSNERLPIQSSHPGTSAGAGPLQPSPRRRHSRLASVTEPGAGQYQPGGAGPAAGPAAAGGAAAAAATGGSDAAAVTPERTTPPGPRVIQAPSMLSPLGRSHHNLFVSASTVTAAPMSTSNPQLGTSDSLLHSVPPQAHGHLQATMSAVSLHVLGASVKSERESDRDGAVGDVRGTAAGSGGGAYRSNPPAGNIATPAAPTASQRSFTSVNVTPSAAAAAAGLMSRPVSNLYICLGDTGKMMETCEAHSTDSSGAVSPRTPTGGVGAGTAAPAATRRTTLSEGPSSILKTMLRSLSTRRSTASYCGTELPQTASSGLAQASSSLGGAPSAAPTGAHGSHPVVPAGVGGSATSAHLQTAMNSGGISPFVSSRASSHNFISNAPVMGTESLGGLSGASHGAGFMEEHGVGGSSGGSGGMIHRRATTSSHNLTLGSGGSGNARIGLPQLSLRGNDMAAAAAAGAAGGPASANGLRRRRAQMVGGVQPARTSDAGVPVARQVSSGGMVGVGVHHASKAGGGLHGEGIGVGGGLGVVGAALPVVRNPTPPNEAPPSRPAPAKNGRDIS